MYMTTCKAQSTVSSQHMSVSIILTHKEKLERRFERKEQKRGEGRGERRGEEEERGRIKVRER